MKTEYVPLYHLIERDTGETMGMDSCFATQLKEGELSCTEECEGAAYYLSSDQSNICKDGYLQRMEVNSAPYRKACITSLLAHQYSRMCGADRELANDIATAAFSWYKGNYKLNGQWTHDHCPTIVEQEVPVVQQEDLKHHYSLIVH